MLKTAQNSKFSNHLFDFVFLSLTLVVLSLSMFSLSTYFANRKPEIKVLGSQIDLEKEEQFWQDVVTHTPTYRDGWIELAKIEAEKGNALKAQIHLSRALEIDPNYQLTKEQDAKHLSFN